MSLYPTCKYTITAHVVKYQEFLMEPWGKRFRILAGGEDIKKLNKVLITFKGIYPVVIAVCQIKTPGLEFGIYFPGWHPDASPVVTLKDHYLTINPAAGGCSSE